MSSSLGRWAVIDLETTGIDPSYDAIIEVGYLQFENFKLIKKYSSLVRLEADRQLNYFVQKLTGITTPMLSKAPLWREVEKEVQDLQGHILVAYNADFEESFLKKTFAAIEQDADFGETTSYLDGLDFMPLLFPQAPSFKLEHFITEWGIKEQESHRGLDDSLDLLKVLLLAVKKTRQDPPRSQFLHYLFQKYQLSDNWFYHLFSLGDEELNTLAEEIDFPLEEFLARIKEKDHGDLQDSVPVATDFNFDGDNIRKIFSEVEKMRALMPHYKYRPSQVELALRLGQSFKNGAFAMAQAPTGTGKTLGYLLPSALFALQGEQVLVATGTKTLQQQLMLQDIPILRKILGLTSEELKITLLVGSGNHCCEALFRRWQSEEGELFGNSKEDKKWPQIYFEVLFYHNAQGGKILYRDNIPYVHKQKSPQLKKLERDIAVDFRSCTGRECPFHHQCSYIQGLRVAKEAHLIIGNHALLLSWPRSFPRPAYLVIDEAHRLEHEGTEAFTLEISRFCLEHLAWQLQHMSGVGPLFYLLAQEEGKGRSGEEITSEINQLRNETQKMGQFLQETLPQISQWIEELFQKGRNFSELYWNEIPMLNALRCRDSLELTILHTLEKIKVMLENMQLLLSPYRGRWEPQQLSGELREQQLTALVRFETFMGGLDDLVLAFKMNMEEQKLTTQVLRYHALEGFLLQAAPVDIGRVIHDHVFQNSAAGLLTSATLGNGSGEGDTRSVEWASGYLYLESKRRFKGPFFFPPIYDYQNKSRVFLCDDVPALGDQEFVGECLQSIVPLIRDLQGRSLILFSAKNRFELAREILLRDLGGEMPIFIQGMGPAVVEDFKKTGHGILLGMESLGEGIDVPGDTLSFLFIDKIPDMRQELIIKERRDFFQKNFGNEFHDYYLAHRARSLVQKLGRLLRTENDFGAAIVVDGRIKTWKGPTLQKMIKLLLPYHFERQELSVACEEVKKFLRSQGLSLRPPT
jgi:ATP-dependent DNA helicase DinG